MLRVRGRTRGAWLSQGLRWNSTATAQGEKVGQEQDLVELWKDIKKSRSKQTNLVKSKGYLPKKEKLRKNIFESKRIVSANGRPYRAVKVDGQPPVPQLAHSLDRVLFSPGVQFVRDPRTNVYNFTPFLENIMSIRDFDFNCIPKWVPSGEDSKLARLAKETGHKFTGSTSSMTGVLSKYHQALSHRRPPSAINVSQNFPGKTVKMSESQKRPISIYLRFNEKTGTYSIDADRAANDDMILSLLGNTLETMLTTPEHLFKNYDKSLSHNIDSPTLESTYNYTECGGVLMRSQLDCYDDRLPGTGMFDLKTRAVCAARHDLDYVQIHDGTDYQIDKLYGQFESFEREWVELIKTQMFKYSLQARIGRMDGIFLAYHNIKRMFGFEYVPKTTMDEIFHSYFIDEEGRERVMAPRVAHATAEAEFTLSVQLLEQTLREVAIKQPPKPNMSFNIVFNVPSEEDRVGQLDVLVKPMLERDINATQTACAEPDRPVTRGDHESYTPNTDPFSIWKHAETHPTVLPADVQVYTLRLESYINRAKVLPHQHPNVGSEDAKWLVTWSVDRHQEAPAATAIFQNAFKDRPYVQRAITSTPQLERLEEKAHEAQRVRAMSRLETPSSLQKLLRRMAAKGKKSVEQEAEHKVMWAPK